jgi:hypothetical protein
MRFDFSSFFLNDEERLAFSRDQSCFQELCLHEMFFLFRQFVLFQNQLFELETTCFSFFIRHIRSNDAFSNNPCFKLFQTIFLSGGNLWFKISLCIGQCNKYEL